MKPDPLLSIIPYEDINSILKKWEKGVFDNLVHQHRWIELPFHLGLISFHDEGSWMNSSAQKSYLQIVDGKKWLLSKIKYGI